MRSFLASREMLRLPVSHHLQFNSLTAGLHHPSLLLFSSCSHGSCNPGCQWIRSNRATSHPDTSMGLVVRVHQGKKWKNGSQSLQDTERVKLRSPASHLLLKAHVLTKVMRFVVVCDSTQSSQLIMLSSAGNLGGVSPTNFEL